MKKLLKLVVAAFAVMVIGTGMLRAEDKAVNDTCPVKGKSVDGSKSVDYTVKFCCEKCVAKFEKDPLALAEKVAAAEDGVCPVSGKAVDDDAAVTVKIAVCCNGCVKKVTADPKKYFGELAGE